MIVKVDVSQGRRSSACSGKNLFGNKGDKHGHRSLGTNFGTGLANIITGTNRGGRRPHRRRHQHWQPARRLPA